MKQNQEGPGLQPERTSMSWFRTVLLMIGNGLLLLLVGQRHNYSMLMIIGSIMLCCAIIITFYNKQRFTQLFSDHMTVGYHEILVKKALSAMIAIAAFTFGTYLLSKLLTF